MKISRVYHRDGALIQVVTRLTTSQRLAMMGFAAAAGAAGWGFHMLDPEGYKYLIPLVFAVIALAMGLGRFVYVIRGNVNVLFRLELFGIPVLSHVVSASSFHSMDITDEPDGSAALRFRDAAERPCLTLEGFPSRESAQQIGGLFPIDGKKQSVAVGRFIEETLREERWFSRSTAAVLVTAVFCFIPGLALLMGWTMDEAALQMTAGAVVTFFTAHVVRRDSGIIAIAENKGHIDRWTREGWFRILEYREHLGEDAGQEMLGVRWDRTFWLLPLLAVLQAGVVFAICRHNEQQAASRVPHGQATPEFHDPEALREGAEILRKFRERQRNDD